MKRIKGSNKSYFRNINNLLFIALACVCLPLQAKEYFEFSHFQIQAPFNISQEPIRADLLPNRGKEIIVLGESEDSLKLALYAFDDVTNTYKLHLQQTIPEHFLGYDLSDENDINEQALYFLTSDNVLRFNPQINANTATDGHFESILAIDSMYINQNVTYLQQLDFVDDLNSDGYDDIILADFRSLNVYLHSGTGSYLAQKLPIIPTVEIFDARVSYTERSYYLIDMTQDGKKDIVIADNGSLLLFAQTKQNKFSKIATTIKVNKDIRGVNWWDARGADGRNLDQSDLQYRTVSHIEDINNDDLPDMVVSYTKSSGVLDKSNDYEIYLGALKNSVLTYSDKANSTVKGEGTFSGLEFVDVNNDNNQEIMVSSFDISVSQIIGALLTGSVDQDVLIFTLDADHNYQQKVSEQVQLKFSLSSGKSGSPVVKLADLDGDGSKELILSGEENSLKIYPGNTDGSLVQGDHQTLDIRLPKNGYLISNDDLDLDGKDEILIRYASEDGEKRHKNLLVLYIK
ncbi:FG-GAP repeat domain-containing protein [Colwelliaceae bacterium BS250]